jgi:hypothetical protein
MSFKKALKNPIFVGDQIGKIAEAATNTLVIDFVLSIGTNWYQLQIFAIMFVSVIMGIIISKNASKIKEFSTKNFKTFMIAEAVARITIGIFTVVTGSPFIYVITSIAIVPFSKIQSIGVICICDDLITDKKEFNIAKEAYSPYVYVIGITIGFLLNRTINGPIAFAILCFSEVVNNYFYLKAYKNLNLK